MEKIRKLKKKIRKAVYPYFNFSAKGTISLFMAVLMTPIFTIALVLVDTGRYNSAISILDEAMGVSAVSTLAEKDAYLHDRWGLFAVDQGKDLKETYSSYLETNAGILGDSISLDSVDVEGIYELADNEILYNQLLEYCKLNAPTKLAINFSNIADLVAKLEKLGNLKSIFDAITGGAGAVDSAITLVESAEDLKDAAKDLEGLVPSYDTDYAAFESAVSSLISALKVPEPSLSDYTDEQGNVDTAAYENAVKAREQDIENAKKNVETSRDTYAETIGKIADSMESYQESMESCVSASEGIATNIASAASSAIDYYNKTNDSSKNLKDNQDEIAELEKDANFNPQNETYLKLKEKEQTLMEEAAEDQAVLSVAKAEQSGLTTMKSGLDETLSKYDDSTFGQCISGLRSLKTTVSGFNVNGVTKDSSGLSAATYHKITIDGFVTAEDIDNYIEEQENELLKGSLKSLIDGLSSALNSLIKMSLFYEPEFSAVIDMDYYNTNFGGLPGDDEDGGSVIAVLRDIGNMINSINDFKKNLLTLKLISALKNIKTLIESIVQCFADLVQFAINIVKNITSLFTSYDRLYYSTYVTFNLPCRTDYGSGGVFFTGMTGYRLTDSSLPDQGIVSNASVFDDLAAALNTMLSYANGSGKDLTFSGAELEYILFGSECEIANQMYVFFALYLLRLLLDIAPVTANAEVQALAASATLAYPVVMALIIFIEPLIDTILLVNGSSIKLIKTSVFLTPSGLPGLIEKFATFVKFTPSEQKNLKSSLVGAFGATDDDYDFQVSLQKDEGGSGGSSLLSSSFFEFNYREYCFLLLLLTVTKEQQFSRLKNLVQMETLYHYQKEGKDYTFDLRKSVTYLDIDVTASVKQIMPSVVSSSLFTAERKQYRGY